MLISMKHEHSDAGTIGKCIANCWAAYPRGFPCQLLQILLKDVIFRYVRIKI